MADSTSSITLAATDGGARAWQKLVKHPEGQSRLNATDIGWVKRNNSRLNVVSNLNKDDKEQDLKFNVVTAGNLSFTSQSDKAIRVQLMNQNGQTVADSNPTSGKLYENYQSLQSSKLTVNTGTYIVKITRDATVPASTEVNYAAQIKMGDTYTDDYVTRIAAKPKTETSISMTANPITGLMPAVLAAQSGTSYTFDPAANAAIFDILKSN
jgi:hypothetical protein